MPKFGITPAAKGFLTLNDLLTSTGTFSTSFKKPLKPGIVFHVEDKNYLLKLAFENESVIFQRNEAKAILSLQEFELDRKLQIIVVWDFTKLTIYAGLKGNKGFKKVEVETAPTLVPPALIKWGRKNNLLPITEYESEELFRQKVGFCLQTIQTKINESGSFYQFWNLVYKGKKIIKRNPKNETEVQPTVHSLLSDQLLISSIDIFPEVKTGVGNIDFTLIGVINNVGTSKIGVEFKNAHSKDLYKGLLTQLPKYMNNIGANYGFYCVLNYKGSWFNEPITKDNVSFEFRLEKARLSSDNPVLKNIRIIFLNLSKPITASK